MLLLSQTGCSIPTALSCCGWDSGTVPVEKDAPLAPNTTNKITTGTTATLPAASADGDRIIVQNATSGYLDSGLDKIQPGGIAIYVVRDGKWVRG